MGLIDTITSGFKVVQRHLWLLILPVLVDVWLWLGPRLSIQPFVDGLLALWSPADLPPALAASVEPYRTVLVEAGARFNLWWLLDNSLTWLRLLSPGLLEPARFGAAGPVVEVSPMALALWVPALLLLGIVVGSALLTAVASQLPSTLAAAPGPAGQGETERQPTRSWGFWLRRGLRTWFVATLYGLGLLALLMGVTVLLSIVLTPLALVAPQVATGVSTLLVLLIGWSVLWVFLMMYFAVAAVASDGVGLIQALRRSFNVVFRNLWTTLGLIVLTTIILSGFDLIWQRLAVLSPVGTLVGIVGNAFLLTSLIAARLIFYRDRYARWEATLASQRAAVPPPANPG